MEEWVKIAALCLASFTGGAALVLYVIRAELGTLKVRLDGVERQLEAGVVTNPMCIERMGGLHREVRLEMQTPSRRRAAGD